MNQEFLTHLDSFYSLQSDKYYFSSAGYVDVWKCNVNLAELPRHVLALSQSVSKYQTQSMYDFLKKCELHHPNIVSCMHAQIVDNNSIFQFYNEQHTFVAYISKPIQSLDQIHLKEQDIVKLIKQIIQVGSYLEDNNEYHGDLRQCNIYQNDKQDFQICLINKVFSLFNNHYFEALHAPEILDQLRVNGNAIYTSKCDVFSFGMILLECYDYTKQRIYYDRVTNLLSHIKQRYPDRLFIIIEMMLQFDPLDRPTFNDLIIY